MASRTAWETPGRRCRTPSNHQASALKQPCQTQPAGGGGTSRRPTNHGGPELSLAVSAIRVGWGRSGGRRWTSAPWPCCWHPIIALSVVLRQLPHVEVCQIRTTPSTQTSWSQDLRSLVCGSLNCHRLAELMGIANKGASAVPPTMDFPYSEERLGRFSGRTPPPLGCLRLLPTLQ